MMWEMQVDEEAHAVAAESNGLEHHAANGSANPVAPTVISRRSKRTRRTLLKEDKAARPVEAGVA